MADTTLPKDELKARAVEGAPLSQGEVSAIESEETSRTGFGLVKGGPAATAQSIHDKQQASFQKAGDLARKPVGEITRENAAEVQKAETNLEAGTGAVDSVHYRLGR
ncbi:hypothetical protein diail_2971 [Diaporthe ilicicola]|nr:hypothetical protein diail_2971 [Diaporthe ilicicola]